MIKTMILAAASAAAMAFAAPQAAAAAGKSAGKPSAVRAKGPATGMPSDNDVLRFACGLIKPTTPEMASNRRKCMEGASLGQGRQRGVRPR